MYELASVTQAYFKEHRIGTDTFSDPPEEKFLSTSEMVILVI